MAVLAWFERNLPGSDSKAKVSECEKWLQKAARWDTYVLDTRIGLKITTAIETLKVYRVEEEDKTFTQK
jgi:hypothetical protein